MIVNVKVTVNVDVTVFFNMGSIVVNFDVIAAAVAVVGLIVLVLPFLPFLLVLALALALLVVVVVVVVVVVLGTLRPQHNSNSSQSCTPVVRHKEWLVRQYKTCRLTT